MKINKKEIYKKLCLSCDTNKPISHRLNEQELREYLLLKKSGGGNIGIIDNKCRYCGKKLDQDNFIISTTYWWPTWQPCCSEECKKAGEAKEAYECQKIDAACNDCKHFKRIEGIHGICSLSGKKITTWRNMAELNDCFEHRFD